MNDPVNRGQGLFNHDIDFGLLSKFYSCFSCTADANNDVGYRPTIFVNMETFVFIPESLYTYYPNEYDTTLDNPTDPVNDTKGKS